MKTEKNITEPELKLIVDIDSVKPNPANPREISDKDLKSLVEKIRRFGIWKPFLIWKSRGIILGGNSRYKACKELGHKEIWVEYREPKDDAEALEMAIADNESSGEWIKPLLIEQIKLSEDKINLEDYKIVIGNMSLDDLGLETDEQGKDKDFEFQSVIRVFVDCTDEDMQEKVFNDLQSLGYEPKVINV